MSMRISRAFGACLAVAMALPVGVAQAQTFYLGAEGGWTVLNDQTSTAAGFPSAKSRFDSGFAAGARVGYEMGPWRFEEEYAFYCGVKHCVGVGNGLEALHLILRAYGIGEGDEVIVPSNTYIATWLAVSYADATPVPVEPDEASLSNVAVRLLW